ncbi:MAG TPA: hypothetical protein VKF32_00620, partial [Thermoanaerobaculia bacterium]|nr:hypothetical protein [Thermoanaerobaculia bacterium]
MRNIIAAAILVSLRLGAGAQSPVSASAEHIDFDRPEAWALKYFIAVSTFTAIGPPAVRQPGSVEVGLELGWIPELDRGQRRVGFEGTTLEDLNKTPLLGRP